MNTHVPTRVVLLCRSVAPTAEEWIWGRRLCEELLRGREHQEHVIVLEQAQPVTVGAALAATSAPYIGIVLDDKALWGLSGWQSLQTILDSANHLAAVAPVSNESEVSQQKVTPPFSYSTPSLLQQAAQAQYQRYCQQWSEVTAIDPFAFLVRRTALSQLDTHLLMTEVPRALANLGGKLAIALDTYMHRYAPVYEQLRPDIQECVPTDARRILDIGCATGLFGAALKQRQDCHVTGIELSAALAETATTRLDRVMVANVETLAQATFSAEFDCITCGDVLEHLRDPWAMVTKCATWLRPEGRLIATTPNIGHWSIVRDLLQGRWDVVPFSLLSWEHIRFFTRAGIVQLFSGCGFTLERLQGMVSEMPSIGEEFLQQSVKIIPGVNLESLRTHEFLIVARKGSRGDGITR